MNNKHIKEIRVFNRFYTTIIGLLDNHILNSKYSLPEVRVMFELYNNPDLTASDIISIIGIDKGYLSRILGKLEKYKLIKKNVFASDKRAVTLHLTKSGEIEFEKLNAASESQIREIFRHLTDADIEKVVQNMREIQTLLARKNN